MKGNPEVLKALNALLADEHGAAIQYGIHAERLDNLGFADAAKAARERQASEREHAAELLARIVFLEGDPATGATNVNVARDVSGILAADLASEMRAQQGYSRAIGLCFDKGDHVTRTLLEHIAAEEETHINYIEGLRTLMKQTAGNVGLLGVLEGAAD